MIVFLNGKFVPEEQAVVSVFDRGFLFGDGLFEAFLVQRGQPFRWDEHFERLQRGIELLKMTLPFSSAQLLDATRELLQRNQTENCMMRLSISRGITERGYSPKNAHDPAVVITLYPPPKVDRNVMAQWPVVTSTHRVLANDPLTAVKSANKLHHVMARAEADAANCNEAILLNSEGHIAEGTTCNVFWIEDGAVCTPEISCGALPGVTRALVLDLCRELKIQCREVRAPRERLIQAEGVFLSMTSFGVVEVVLLDGRRLKTSKLTGTIHSAFNELLHAG